MMMKYIIFDLDGTLADISDRRKLSTKPDGDINWGTFFEPNNIDLDVPVPAMVFLYQMLVLNPAIKIVMFSGRSGITLQATLDWFEKHNIRLPYILWMRQTKDYTPDNELKAKWFEELLESEKITKKDILFAVDDRNKVVEMWRNLGITCLQCEEGDF